MVNRKIQGKPTVVLTKNNFFIQLLSVVVLSTVVINPVIFDSFIISKLLVLSVGLLYIATRIFSKSKKSEVRNLPLLVSVPVFLFIVSLTLSWGLSGVPILRGLFGQFGRGNGLFYYYFAILVFVFAAKTFRKTDSARMHQFMTLLSWFLAIYAGLQRIGIDIAKLDTRGISPVVLTFGNSNFAGAMLSVLFTYHFIYLVTSKRFKVSEMFLLICLILSSTFAAAVQGYLIILFALSIGATIGVSHKFRSKVVNAILISSWVVLLVNLVLGLAGKSILAGIFARPSFQARIEYWRITSKVIKDNFLFGVGPDKLYDVTSNYMAPGSLKLITTTRMDNAHNWFLNLTANYGLFSISLLTVIIGVILCMAFNIVRNQGTQNSLAMGSILAFLALLIDGLVSIEQPGLGIWLYLFGGIIVGTHLDSMTFTKSNVLSSKIFGNSTRTVFQLFAVINIFALIMTTSIISIRIYNDATLRSSVQIAMLNKGTVETFKKIEKASISLRSEPEYAVQALGPLAAIGDAQKLESISAASYNYYSDSIQANLIRADVLLALGRESESCPLRLRVLRNTPWDKSLLEKYLVCLDGGFVDSNLQDTLKLVTEFFDPDVESVSVESSKQLSIYQNRFAKIATYAKVYNLQGNTTLARKFQFEAKNFLTQIEKLELERNDPSQVMDKRIYIKMISFR